MATETRYRVRVKTFEDEIKSYAAKTRKEAEDLFNRESHPLHSPSENYQVQLQDSGRERIEYRLVVAQCDLTNCGCTSRTREEYEAWKLAQVKPSLTPETITYTIVERPTTNGIPFIARVLVPGQEVQEYDPQPSCWWMYTEGDLVNAVNKHFKGAWYLKPEVFEQRIAEQAERAEDANDASVEVGWHTNAVLVEDEPLQQQPEQQQQEQLAPDERQVTRTERRNEFSLATSYGYYHPECYSQRLSVYQFTSGLPVVSGKTTCVVCGKSVHVAPEQERTMKFEVKDLLINEYNGICQIESIVNGVVTLDWRKGMKTHLPVSHFANSSFRLATLPEDKERVEFFYSQPIENPYMKH